MARRSSSCLVAFVLAALALYTLAPPFVTAPQQSLRGAVPEATTQAAQAAALGAVLAAVPDVAHAANQGYAVLQLGWAVFIIGLGPAVLFWIYFNKPEIL
eukprot:CAMPEP_0183426540 /NCGR_PEP_ID=MMETSP0370-20130417/39760_1 /TAXON_ID=268820 /ORGANISM="Peridinium aciculiferum, Strain PAER-2" /LENGTH=99 /DNA_ID=CAMNT_0025610971 /DNA_START=59 /DNA_END=358 /DNA_ORIENTATION=+